MNQINESYWITMQLNLYGSRLYEVRANKPPLLVHWNTQYRNRRKKKTHTHTISMGRTFNRISYEKSIATAAYTKHAPFDSVSVHIQSLLYTHTHTTTHSRTRSISFHRSTERERRSLDRTKKHIHFRWHLVFQSTLMLIINYFGFDVMFDFSACIHFWSKVYHHISVYHHR